MPINIVEYNFVSKICLTKVVSIIVCGEGEERSAGLLLFCSQGGGSSGSRTPERSRSTNVQTAGTPTQSG